MAQRITVEAVTKKPRIFNNQLIWGVKTDDGTWYSLYVEDQPTKGASYECIVTENKGKDGRTYFDAKPIRPAMAPEPAPQSQTNGAAAPAEAPKPAPVYTGPTKIAWLDWQTMTRAAHAMAMELEPDQAAVSASNPLFDRSTARIAMVNTIMIAFSNGKLDLPDYSVGREPGADDGDDFPL